MPGKSDIWNSAADAPVRLRRDGAVATITLNRPQSLNAIDIEMAERLAASAEAVKRDPGIRVLLVKGAGAAFCAGGDVQLFAANIDNIGPIVGNLLTELDRFIHAIRSMDAIVVMCVHRVAAGAGCSLAFMGDFCVAADDARFKPAYAAIGLSPDAGGTIGIAKQIGPRRAMRLFLADDHLGAREAHDLGLVSHLVSAASLDEEADRLVARLLGQNAVAVAMTKHLLYGTGDEIRAQLDREREGLMQCLATAAFRERVSSFGSAAARTG